MTGKDLKKKLELTGIPLRQIADALGISEQNLQNKMSSADIKVSFLCKISKALHKSIYFLLDGQDFYKETSDVSQSETTPIITSNPPTEESLIYKMYREKDEENKALIRENGRLEERIRQLESQDMESEPIIGLTDSFTDKSSGDYGEDFMPTKKSPSKKSSAGKAL